MAAKVRTQMQDLQTRLNIRLKFSHKKKKDDTELTRNTETQSLNCQHDREQRRCRQYTQEGLEIRAEWTYLGTQLNRIRLSKENRK